MLEVTKSNHIKEFLYRQYSYIFYKQDVMTGTFNAHIKEAITEYCTFEVLWPSWPTDKEILTKVAYYTLQSRGPILTQEKASWIKLSNYPLEPLLEARFGDFVC